MKQQEAYKCEKIVPYDEKQRKKEQIRDMFDSIAEHYDTMNRTMSIGVDVAWRKKAILKLKKYNPKTILDVATGTGDFAIDAYRLLLPQKIIGIDLSEKMLEVGRKKVNQLGLASVIDLKEGDSLALPFDSAKFDAVTVAFGVRNFENLSAGITEMQRVLKTGGQLLILEMSEPNGFIRPFYAMYSKFLIPIIARFFSKDIKAYRYLPNSIKAFPKEKEMKTLLRSCGFFRVEYTNFTFGICSCYLAVK
jgi:demethylmenaquinone methyltransferase/2-methoxy-6-polyprenyl-1,4-benzoquinol methylase